jgi:hypothetical protein
MPAPTKSTGQLVRPSDRTVTVAARIDAALAAALQREARRRGVSVSFLVAELIRGNAPDRKGTP